MIGAPLADDPLDRQERRAARSSSPPLPPSVSELDLQFILRRVKMERPPQDEIERVAYITDAIKQGETLFSDRE